MSGADPSRGVDEFEAIARLLRPLAEGAPEALGLRDDAAVVPSRPGFDLVITKDAMVEGVHFLQDDPPDLIARKLLRVNLSDLAAKGAEPYGYFLAAAWPARFGWPERERFAAGLAQDQARFGLKLMGGDTVSTPGPLTLSATLLGWVPTGRTVLRSGARPGDRLLVSGTIGDGVLGLKAARGELDDAWLADRYRLPEPRLDLTDALRANATAAADVSDGLIADAGHIAEASGVALLIELERVPLSAPAKAWLEAQPDPGAALVQLTTGGDDYEVVCTAPAGHGLPLTEIGVVIAGEGVETRFSGRALEIARKGWRH
jgi:thiamine-monophosphate kinase